jgi:ABC-type branched-subunit amino acid transport system ATPase component
LIDFRLDLAKFTCLIGLNGAGKSTVLQFIDFLAQQVRGDIKGWLEERHWEAKDLKSQLTKKKNTIDFSVLLTHDPHDPVAYPGTYGAATWEATFNSVKLQCTHEKISAGYGNVELLVSGGLVEIGELLQTPPATVARKWSGLAPSSPATNGGTPVSFKYEGSILSQLKESSLPAPLVEFKDFFLNVKSLDLLSPEYLRLRTRESGGSLGLGGQRLSAFLHELGTEKRRRLVRQLKSVYPQLKDLQTRAARSGLKQLEITEKYHGEKSGMTTEARYIADGMLRLIAILAETQTEHRFLLFDEIENGINPELVEFVLDALVSAPQQVLVTTHSPMILNYLDDQVAREGVVYVYKRRDGQTRAIRFFDIPSIAEKLTVMGPGEAFADTDLTALHDEIEAVTGGR